MWQAMKNEKTFGYCNFQPRNLNNENPGSMLNCEIYMPWKNSA